VRPLRTQTGIRREASKLRRRATTNLRKVERRGATTRKRAQRKVTSRRGQVTRSLRRNRREAEQQVRAVQQEFGRRADDAQTTAIDALRRTESQARSLS
jgi:hypothetical protein